VRYHNLDSGMHRQSLICKRVIIATAHSKQLKNNAISSQCDVNMRSTKTLQRQSDGGIMHFQQEA